MASSGWQPLTEPTRRVGDGDGRAAFTVSPFARLARVQALATASDALVALSLAGSLFFSIPTGEARGRVALYLLLTIAPFAVVGPVMGPALDRVRGGRRLLVVATGASRVLVCLLMARHIDSLLLFPEAFAALVLTKAYAVAKSAIVPTVVSNDEELVQANSKLSLLTGVSSLAAGLPGALVLKLAGPEWVLVLAAIAAALQALLAARLPAAQIAAEEETAEEQEELRSAGVVLSSEAMGLMRGVVGFLTFLLAFSLRGGSNDTPVPQGLALGRAVRSVAGYPLSAAGQLGGAPAWHYGVVLAVSMGGALAGAFVAPKLRASTGEERILQGCLVAMTAAGVVATALGGLLGAAVLAFVVGMASSTGKLAFDSIVQRDAPDANRGRMFARFETRFQLLWVIGAFVPVVVPLPERIGFLVVAIAAGFALFSYLGGSRGLEGKRPPSAPPPEPVVPEAETVLVGPPVRWLDDE
jgi:hypothetical protein